MTLLAPWTLLLAALPLAPVRTPQADEPTYPASTALAEGVSPDALAALDELVQSFVDDGEVVGAELLVIRNGRSILHSAHGWRDREAQVPMEPGGVFCVRSMTKPLIGAAIRMLFEEDRLDLDDRVAAYLPAFDTEGQRDITVEHLLTHTSGLPMSLILGKDPRTLESLRAVADLGGGCALEFEPGSGFRYSDQGTDTLTALIEVVTGAPAEEFVAERVLEPLGMRDSACVLAADDPLRARAGSLYVGAPGSWTRYWGPDEPALFGVFLGSQGLYSTLEDYARFLELWTGKGRAGGQRLLRRRSVRETLTPGPFPLGASTGFTGLQVDYGGLMQLWTRPAPDGGDGEREVVVFGHTGSDGTHAWAFPEQRAMVLYFTQSRGTGTGLRVEERLGELLLGVPFDPIQAAPPLEQYLGYYWEGEGDLYRAIVRDGDGLALEILGKAAVPLVYVGEDRWKLAPQPGTVLAFDRDGSGAVTGYHIGDHQELRFEPDPGLPTAEEVAARVAQAHRVDRLEALGPLRIRGTLTIDALGLAGTSTTWLAWPDRWRSDETVGAESGSVAFDGERVWYAAGGRPAVALQGQAAELLRVDSLFARFGDWHRWHPDLRVIQRIQREDEDAVLVRAGDTSAPATTFYIDWSTGLVGRVDGMTYAEGMGRIGQRVSFGDYRAVSGVMLPHQTRVQLANPLIGEIVSTIEKVELDVELPEGLFDLTD